MAHLKVIERTTKSKMKRMMPPTIQEERIGQQQITADKILKTVEENDVQPFHESATKLREEHDSVTIISAALKMLTKERRNVLVRISSVAPVSDKKGRRKNHNRRSNNKRYYGKRGKGGSNRKRKGNVQKRRNR